MRDIAEVIEENSDTLEELDDWSKPPISLTFDGYAFTLEEEKGGGEDEGSYCHKVFAVKREDLPGFETEYWMVIGYYQSHYGSEWDWSEAKRVERYRRVIRDWREYGSEGEADEE